MIYFISRGFVIIVGLLALFALISVSCGSNDKVIVISKTEKTCGGMQLGTIEDRKCKEGYEGKIIYVCTEKGWNEEINTFVPKQ
jgi:hypothetical protein